MSTVVKSHKNVCSLQKIMGKKTIFSFLAFAIIILLVRVVITTDEVDVDFSEKAKIHLRDIGNQLLLSNQDSTSLILPVVEINSSKYELSFQNQLSFIPDSLVTIVSRSILKSELSKSYRVEVIQCLDNEVAYSYEMNEDKENTIIPCLDRSLPNQCYKIQIRFLDKKSRLLNNQILFYALILITFLLIQLAFFKTKPENRSNDKEYTSLGSFRFYPDQNKLVKEAAEISLSKKECELLEIFVANPNQIIKRDELTKKIWEDNGVFVGRSLDTYISKLRKKLKEDSSIKIVNIHGVGYKLEIINK
ncbi:winged helix-turn-helix domain-containing protein [Pseudotenacibaculum sp. MALMAid0570]